MMKKIIWEDLNVEQKLEYLKKKPDITFFTLFLMFVGFAFIFGCLGMALFFPYLDDSSKIRAAKITADLFKIGQFALLGGVGAYLIFALQHFFFYRDFKKYLLKNG